jgi:hypothetical protein
MAIQYSRLKVMKKKLRFAKMGFKVMDTQFLQVPLHVEQTYTIDYMSDEGHESFTGRYVGYNKKFILLYKVIGDLNEILVTDDQNTYDLAILHSIITPDVVPIVTMEFAVVAFKDIIYILKQ